MSRAEARFQPPSPSGLIAVGSAQPTRAVCASNGRCRGRGHRKFRGCFRAWRSPTAPLIFPTAKPEFVRGLTREMQCKKFQVNWRIDFQWPQGSCGSRSLEDPQKPKR